MNDIQQKKFVCMGGGIGTSNLIRGLKAYSPHITVVTSMADDGGSSGRLRETYNMLPPGDLVSCIAALQPENESDVSKMLTHRFFGDTHPEEQTLNGHKLGNLIMLAAYQITGNFNDALEMTKKMFHVTADILPATLERTHLSAITKDGRTVHGETTLDLAMHGEPYGLKEIYLTPSKPEINPKVIKNISEADIIISGPGDLYTNQLPVLIIPEIKEALIASKAKKLFILNVANKPFETKDFTLRNYVETITEHLGAFPFDTIIANNNTAIPIPKEYEYHYIHIDTPPDEGQKKIIVNQNDIINQEFPIYHDSQKLASVIAQAV